MLATEHATVAELNRLARAHLVARGDIARRSITRKGRLPNPAVYGPTEDAALRLITRVGSFDRQRGSHDDNHRRVRHVFAS
jgi:hypothetical protein